MKYQYNFSIETWIDDLEEHTFRSKFIDLTYEQGLSLSKSENKRTQEDMYENDTFFKKYLLLLINVYKERYLNL